MRPAATALNYSVKDIRNDVRQKIYEKSQQNRLVWGSLTLAPISDILSAIYENHPQIPGIYHIRPY